MTEQASITRVLNTPPAAEHQQNPSVCFISATTSKYPQVLQLPSGSNLTLFTFYNLTDAAVGPCNGTCFALNTSHTEQIDGENCKVDLEKGIPEMNVIIETAVSEAFVGIWSCTLRTPSIYTPGAMSIQSAVFRVFVTPTGWNAELTKTPSGSLMPVNVRDQGTRNVTLEGEQPLPLELSIEGKYRDYQAYDSCVLTCHIVSHDDHVTESCKVNNTNITAKLKLSAYIGLWNCTVNLKQAKEISRQQQANPAPRVLAQFKLNILEKKTAVLGLSSEQIIIIAIAVSTIVALIIVGQTICIIHFKKKAKRAQIDKNLTPKNTINEGSSTERYVNKKSGTEGSGKGEVEECIYEALESARDEPPPLPSLATLPVTPKPQHLMRSASQSNLLDGARATTTPRPPRSHQSPDTVARSSSLERISKRPPQPLPTEAEIYEDVAPDGISPIIKRKIVGMKSTAPGPKTPMGPNRPSPAKPLPGLPSKSEFLKPPGPNVGRPPTANKFSAGAKPMRGLPMLPPVTSGPGGMPMGGIPLLPSMISAAKLKPVNKTKPKPPPPVTERPRHPHALPTPPSTSAKPYKPKPPVPLPQPEPIPEDFESVSDDSDDEFKCYDVLPDFNIYGNGAY